MLLVVGPGANHGLADFSAALGVMQMLLTGMRSAALGQGADADTTAFLCSPAIRSAIHTVLEALLQSAGTVALNAWRRYVGTGEGPPSSLVRDLEIFANSQSRAGLWRQRVILIVHVV